MASKLQASHQSHQCTSFTAVVMLTLLAVATVLQTEVEASVGMRSYLGDRDYPATAVERSRYALFRPESKKMRFRTDLGKRFSQEFLERPEDFLREENLSYENLSDLSEQQKRRMFRNDLGKK